MIASRLVVLAVVVLAAIATADAFRPEGEARVESSGGTREGARLVGGPAPEYVAEGAMTRTHVLRRGREYLTAEQIEAAFPAPLEGAPFDVAHIATAPDGTVAIAVYKFPATGPVRAAIEFWHNRTLLSAFMVPRGSFGGGLGFTADGRLIATVSPDGVSATLFRRDGEPVGRIPVTSW